MSTTELKQIDDGSVNIYPLTEAQILVVKESQQEVRERKFLSEDDANKEIDEWLEK